jgi:hypothetical protein
MSNLNNSNLKDIITTTLQEILAEDPNFFFADRLSILTWKSKKIDGALITKIGNQRYLGLLRKDRQGQDYWKYRPLSRNSDSEQSDQESSAVQPNSLDNITKFQQRQEQTREYGKSNSEQSVNSQSS